MEGFSVNLADLSTAAKGIEDAVAALSEVGVVQTASAGWGVSFLAVTHVHAGHADYAEALGEFCTKWDWAMRSLIQEGQLLSQHVLDTRTAYERAEDAVDQILKRVVVAAVGDPTLQGEDAHRQSWEQISQSLEPDSSPESYQQARERIEAAGERAWDDAKVIGEHAVNPISQVRDFVHDPPPRASPDSDTPPPAPSPPSPAADDPKPSEREAGEWR